MERRIEAYVTVMRERPSLRYPTVSDRMESAARSLPNAHTTFAWQYKEMQEMQPRQRKEQGKERELTSVSAADELGPREIQFQFRRLAVRFFFFFLLCTRAALRSIKVANVRGRGGAAYGKWEFNSAEFRVFSGHGMADAQNRTESATERGWKNRGTPRATVYYLSLWSNVCKMSKWLPRASKMYFGKG